MQNKTQRSFKSFTSEITTLIIAELEKGNPVWKQPWKDLGLCKNYQSQRPYTGFNQFYLSWLMQKKGFNQPYFLTYKQANDLGGHVRKGEKGITVVFWKQIQQKKQSEIDTETTNTTRLFPFLHTVFNIGQIEGIKFLITEKIQPQHLPIQACEAIVSQMPSSPNIIHGGNQAYYSPSLDFVQLPLPEQFITPENYYQTAFHELIHSTGHKSRLNRFKAGEMPARFGDENYSKEELIAEIGATILSASAGIHQTIISSSAGYIKGWLRALQNDHTLIFSAANQADKAVSFITGNSNELIETETANATA